MIFFLLQTVNIDSEIMAIHPSLTPIFKNPLESVVNYSDPRTHFYLGSPSIAKLSDGAIIVSHDHFGPGNPKNQEFLYNTTKVFRSDDVGKNWTYQSMIPGAFWSGLFIHKNALYLLGCSSGYGDIVIRKSDDGGKNWTIPQDEKSGLLFPRGMNKSSPKYHGSATPVLVEENIYRAFEDNVTGEWGSGFHAAIISAKSDSDLLRADSWVMTNKLKYNSETQPADFGKLKGGWLEGNVVRGPDNKIWNILRVNSAPAVNKAAITKTLK